MKPAPGYPGHRWSESKCICAGPFHFPAEGCGIALNDAGMCATCVEQCCDGTVNIPGATVCPVCNANYLNEIPAACCGRSLISPSPT